MKNQRLTILIITSICWLALLGCAPGATDSVTKKSGGSGSAGSTGGSGSAGSTGGSGSAGSTGGSGSAGSTGGGSGSMVTIAEGVWISNCRKEDLGGYIRFTNTFAGNTYKLEQLTYSDNQCTQVSSGNDYRAEGTFTLEDGGTLEGKQLTKITATMTVLFSEGIAALFTPIGSTQTIVAKQYLDGDTSYETDDFYDLFTGQYREPTKIVYEEYLVKQ
jgi:hypothetical protein